MHSRNTASAASARAALAATIVALLAVLAARPATGEIVTVVESSTAPSGTFDGASVACPGGMDAVGGGVDSALPEMMPLTESAPYVGGDLYNAPPGSNPAPTGWVGQLRNDDATARELKVAAVCAPEDESTTTEVVEEAVPESFESVGRTCATGRVAVGSGASPLNVLNMVLTSTTPTIAGVGVVYDGTRDEGAPDGGYAAFNNLDLEDRDFKLGVICRDATELLTRIQVETLVADTSTTLQVLCPAGTVAYSGGVQSQNILYGEVTSSAPVFGPDPEDDLIEQADGTHGPPRGWQGSVRKQGGTEFDVAVAVVCPEPGVPARAAGSLAALALLAARRRRP